MSTEKAKELIKKAIRGYTTPASCERALLNQALSQLEPEPNKCQWTKDNDFDYWETSCGQAQEFISGDVEDNHYKYCPYCGKEIEHRKEIL